MKKISLLSVLCALCSVGVADAAGTYYNGAYQSPQRGYSAGNYASQPYRTPVMQAQPIQPTQTARPATYSNTGYSRYGNQVVAQNVARQPVATAQPIQLSAAPEKSGFYLDAGISHSYAQWQFDMAQAGSSLQYNNLVWNILDVNAGYVFGGNTKMQVNAGIQYGMQSGESSMVDDDITNGGYFVTQWCENTDEQGNCINPIGDQVGHALSIGTSSGGDMFGYNVAFGLTDFFQLGNFKITPSIGWRNLTYNVQTKQNFGMAIDTVSAGCVVIDGETQCDPAIILIESGTGQQYLVIRDQNGNMENQSGFNLIEPTGTYYYAQPDVSHSYEVTWAGPYISMDAEYIINQNNLVNARLEVGLPGYTATGDQPYRFDWAHPKSVEDTAGMGSAMHLGLGANYQTAVTDTVMLSIGLTYDYYSVSGADAKTYLNGDYYNSLYDSLLTAWNDDEAAMLNPETGDTTAIGIKQLEKDCPGWTCSTSGEIESFYNSLGVRIGFSARF